MANYNASTDKNRNDVITHNAQKLLVRIDFEKFDKNSNGKISLDELKSGLEASLKTEIPWEHVHKLMNKFDVSCDGYLQLEEMVSVDRFSKTS